MKKDINISVITKKNNINKLYTDALKNYFARNNISSNTQNKILKKIKDYHKYYSNLR